MAASTHDGVDAPVAWRGGVHIAGTPIWCDARRPRQVCFASCAHAIEPMIGGSQHAQVIATAPTLALLARDGDGGGAGGLPAPLGRPFTLGTTRLELVPSGHAPGGASLVADVKGRRVLYAGPVNPRGNAVGEPCELRACDAVVIAAAYAAPRLAPAAEIAPRVAAFAREVTAGGGAAALLVSSPGKGAEVAALLARLAPDVPLCAHSSIHRATRRLGASFPQVPAVPRWSARAIAGRAVLWPIARRRALDALRAHARVAAALVSGLAADADATAALAVEAAFAWSNLAGTDEIAAYVDACGARRVFLTHRYAEPLAAALDRPDRPARALGPPRQLSLRMNP